MLLIYHGFFTKSRAKNVTFKLTIWIHNRAKEVLHIISILYVF